MPTPCSRAMVRMLLPAARAARIVWTLAASSATVAGRPITYRRPLPVPARPSIRVFSKSLHEQKLRNMRKFIRTAIPAIHAIPAVGMSICKRYRASGTGMQLQADYARTRFGSTSGLPKLKEKNFAEVLCVRVRSIDRPPPGGGLRSGPVTPADRAQGQEPGN